MNIVTISHITILIVIFIVVNNDISYILNTYVNNNTNGSLTLILHVYDSKNNAYTLIFCIDNNITDTDANFYCCYSSFLMIILIHFL